jgi:hypothetical protein
MQAALAHGYQLCARCGNVMVTGVTVEIVERASFRHIPFWLIYSHIPGSLCPPDTVKGWSAVQKAIDYRIVTSNGYVPPIGSFSEMRYVRVGNCGSTKGKPCAARVKEPYAQRWRLELAAVALAQHDLLACDCGKAPKHNEEQDTNPGDVELWASTLQAKFMDGQPPVTPRQRLFARADYPPRSSWEWLRELVRDKNPTLLSVMDRIEAEIMRRERPVTYVPGLIEFGSPSLTFFGDKRTVQGTRARDLNVRSRALGPGIRKRPLSSGRVLKRAPDGTPIEFQGAGRTCAVHLRDSLGKPVECALWFSSELSGYIKECELCEVAPPLGRLPFDHRSAPELFRLNGRIYTLNKWAAFQFCTLLLRILAAVPR